MRNVRTVKEGFKKSIWMVLGMVYVLCIAGAPAKGTVFDHFNDGVLDPAWQISFDKATGWTYAESGTNLTVSDITAGGSGWNYVMTSQGFSAASDFDVKCAFSWDSKSQSSAMQTLSIRVFSNTSEVAHCGYHDAWVTHRGEKAAMIEGVHYNGGQDTLPYAGDATISIKRVSGLITINWNDAQLMSGLSSSVISKVDMAFVKDPQGTFGSLSTDYISAVPEPVTILLFGLGALSVLAKRRRQG